MFERILIAHDGSEGADRALDSAIELATRFQSDLHMISIEEDLPRYARTIDDVPEEKEREDTYFGQIGEQCRRRAAFHGINLQHTIIAGHAVKSVAEFVKEGKFQLLVIGYTGHSRLYEHLWGGTSQNLTRVVLCDVLVVK
jgi:nucleotide-binding universal stress UspA family protein